MKRMLAASLITILLSTSANAARPGYDLPATFVAHRVYLDPTLANGKTMRFYTDSGGGGNSLCRDAAKRVGIATTPMPPDPELEKELGKNLANAHMPAFAAGHAIPVDLDGENSLLVHDCKPSAGMPADAFGDAFLSSRWFAGRVWTWNYPGSRLRLEGSDYMPDASATTVPLGFRKVNGKTSAQPFARIAIEVDGKPIDMLFDTGATTMLAPAALAAIKDGQPALRATSFMVRSQIDAWHKAHPDWRIVEKAEAGSGSRMIEVPSVDIAGFRTGPVWFTQRPDYNFQQWMTSMMDQEVQGAVGGNVFRHFVVTVDYPKERAHFRCVEGCTAVH
jgi:hypothetical protein